MSDELLRVIGVGKTVDRGRKYYQAIIGKAGFQHPWNHRYLLRKCRTWTEAHEYGLKALARLAQSRPRAKKSARFS